MKVLLFTLVLVLGRSGWAEDKEAVAPKTFREKLREKIKDRWIKKQNEIPPPKSEPSTEEKISKPGDYVFSLVHDNLTRRYTLHIPAKYNSANPTPLLLAFHGGGGDMTYQADDKKYKLISKSEEAGFIAIFPSGYSQLNSGKLATWNAGKCCGAARDKKIDDVGFIKAVINKTTKQLNIDQTKVFAIGMSNGAMMSYRLACEMPDVFKAIAAVAGTDNTIECTPKNPISILHIHAKNDDHVLFNGGAGFNAQSKLLVTDFVSVPLTISKWTKLNGCNEVPKKILEKSGAYCELYSQCKGNANVEVQLCVTDTGRHSWPGGEKSRGDEAPSKAISANDVIWDFFTREVNAKN